MRTNILMSFKHDLQTTLEDFEKESGGRHNRRPEISAALSALEGYISRAENPLILLNTIEAYIRNFLTGFFKGLVFRDEYQLRKCLYRVLNQPEYSLQALGHTWHHESELEKLQLCRLIAQLEDRVKSLENGKEETPDALATASSEFDHLRVKIAHLEECERLALVKISDLENEKWVGKREIIALRDKIELLDEKNSRLQEENKTLKAEFEKIILANQNLEIESLAKNTQLMFHETPCRVF